MKTKIYLYDAVGEDKELNLDQVNLQKIKKDQLLWINIFQRDEAVISEIIDVLQLKNIPLKIILNKNERPKVDIFENFFRFLIITVEADKNKKLKRVPIDIIAGKNFVITIHEGEVKYFNEFQDREKGETTLGKLDAESFIATLLDLHLVSYFRALENIEEEVDKLDEEVLKKDLNIDDFLTEIVHLRQKISNLRRWFLPHRDVFYTFSRPDFRQFAESDIADQFLQLNQHFENAFNSIESSRDTLLGLFELYATKSSQLTNELVQRLTFITLITGFLGLIAGILGMNFEVEELFKSKYGFYITIGGMLLVALSLSGFAKIKRWI